MKQISLQLGHDDRSEIISLLIVVILCVAPSTILFAESISSHTGSIESVMRVYFSGEKTRSLIKTAVGILGVVIGIILFRKNHFGKGMAYTLVAIAVVELIVGGTVYLRTDSQLAALIEQFRLEPVAYQSEELARMTAVLSSFATYRMIQIGMVIVGAILFLIARAKKRSTFQGVGTGFIIMGPVLLVMDLLGTARAEVYFEALQKLGG